MIKLVLKETSIPEDAFPSEQLLVLPTYARMTTKDGKLNIDLILRDPNDEVDGLPDFSQPNPTILPLSLQKDRVIRLNVRRSWTQSPYAELYVQDPGGVYDELYLLFGPWSRNNPCYHIDAFANMLRETLAVPVEYEKRPEEPECPF